VPASSPDDDALMQPGAKPGEVFPNDERDGRDAGAGTGNPPGEQNTTGWEEGEL